MMRLKSERILSGGFSPSSSVVVPLPISSLDVLEMSAHLPIPY